MSNVLLYAANSIKQAKIDCADQIRVIEEMLATSNASHRWVGADEYTDGHTWVVNVYNIGCGIKRMDWAEHYADGETIQEYIVFVNENGAEISMHRELGCDDMWIRINGSLKMIDQETSEVEDLNNGDVLDVYNMLHDAIARMFNRSEHQIMIDGEWKTAKLDMSDFVK